MPELVIKSAIQNGDLLKPKTIDNSVLKPLEDILNKHYVEKVMNKHGDIMKVFPKGVPKQYKE
jgi:hypothetical protein